MTKSLINSSFNFKGYRIAFHQSGVGRPVIMLHNGGSSHIIWKNQISHFADTYRVMALDLLGFGDSDRPAIPFTLELYVDLLENFISVHHISRPILMGNCIGASVALEYALHNPGEVDVLILCNVCGGSSMMKYTQPLMFTNQGKVYNQTTYQWMFTFSKLNFIKKQVLRQLFGRGPITIDEIYQHLLEGMKHPMQPQSRLMLMKGVESFNKFDTFSENTALLPPTLISWGEENLVLSVKRGKKLIENLQATQSIIYPGLGHLPMVEDPNLFNRDIDRFLEQFYENY